MPSQLGQEMLHGYGVNHARLDGSTADYRDPFDVMSVGNAFIAMDPNFGQTGPGLNAVIMDSKGWLDPERVWTYPGGNSSVQLWPHHRRDLPGFLVATVGPYYVEFRMSEGFDAAIQDLALASLVTGPPWFAERSHQSWNQVTSIQSDSARI
jgi:hypothetical protein